MENNLAVNNYPYLLTRKEAATFLGIDPKSFDKHFRSHNDFKRFMIGGHERYTISFMMEFINKNHV